MTKKQRSKPLNFWAWIAVAATGWPAPVVGYRFTRKALRAAYREQFGHDLERAGYQATKVRISEIEP